MDCTFCDFENEIKYRLLEETDNFYLIPGLGAFIEGYLLIISKKHYENLSEMPIETLDEFKILETLAINFLKETYGTEVIEYEHGCCSLTNETSGACISHLHLVIVATNKNLLPTIEKHLGTGERIEKFSDFKNLGSKFSSYILYKKNQKILLWSKKRVLSQFIRRLLCEESGNKFNWRLHPHTENIAGVIKKWKKWKKT